MIVSPPVGAARPSPPATDGDGHLSAVDLMRFLTVGAVIVVHASSQAVSSQSVAANGVLAVAHMSRSVFLAMSALVLTYSFDRRPLSWVRFWRRRYPLVVVPYVVWSLAYVLAGGRLDSPLTVTGRFVADLFDGGAHYHLYFLLLTFQLYLVFPALMAPVRRWPRCLWPALAASGVFQVGFEAAVHYGWRPPVLSLWLTHPSSWLVSYPFYVVAGVAIARHLHQFGAWVDSHRPLVAWASAGAVAVALGSYVFDLTVLGYPPVKASEVFQPADMLMAVAALAGEFTLGVWLVRRLDGRGLARLRTSSDVSFGVYLAHPLILTAVLSLAAWSGLSEVVGAWPGAVTELLVVAGLVPFVYAVSFGLVAAARRSPASLALTGRRPMRDAG